jgi:hypothetical protein
LLNTEYTAWDKKKDLIFPLRELIIQVCRQILTVRHIVINYENSIKEKNSVLREQILGKIKIKL